MIFQIKRRLRKCLWNNNKSLNNISSWIKIDGCDTFIFATKICKDSVDYAGCGELSFSMFLRIIPLWIRKLRGKMDIFWKRGRDSLKLSFDNCSFSVCLKILTELSLKINLIRALKSPTIFLSQRSYTYDVHHLGEGGLGFCEK